MCLVFNSSGHVIGIEAMVSTASVLVENLRRGEYKLLRISQKLPEEMLLLMVIHLTSDTNVSLKGLRTPAQMLDNRLTKLESMAGIASNSKQLEKRLTGVETRMKTIEDSLKSYQLKVTAEFKAKNIAILAVTSAVAAATAASSSNVTAAALAATTASSDISSTAGITSLLGKSNYSMVHLENLYHII